MGGTRTGFISVGTSPYSNANFGISGVPYMSLEEQVKMDVSDMVFDIMDIKSITGFYYII